MINEFYVLRILASWNSGICLTGHIDVYIHVCFLLLSRYTVKKSVCSIHVLYILFSWIGVYITCEKHITWLHIRDDYYWLLCSQIFGFINFVWLCNYFPSPEQICSNKQISLVCIFSFIFSFHELYYTQLVKTHVCEYIPIRWYHY
jgi:hypothetical protein